MLRSRGRHAQIRRCLYGTASAAVISIASSAHASGQDAKMVLDIPAEPLSSALKSVSVATDNQVLFSEDLVAGRMAPALKGQYSVAEALAILVKDTNLHIAQSRQHVFLVEANPKPMRVAANTAPQPSGTETVVVTAQHKSEDIQQVPISITALSQKDLTERQIAGGPDLVKDVPNLTFTKTNFTGYDLQIRGIGTQAISVTTDPAVAVAFNDIPFIRNHFFEQEFYDLQDVEVLRGPQGTLYGRNATAGVVNIKSAMPTDSYEAMLSADLGNYSNRRLEGMVNIPIVDDKLDLRIAGEWTKRDGYSFNTITDEPIDGRDLWSGRVSLAFKPTSDLQSTFVWEHFSEDDDRLRSGKQLCGTDYLPATVDGYPIMTPQNGGESETALALSQGCSPVSLYSPQAFGLPYSWALPEFAAGRIAGVLNDNVAPYSTTTQSSNLRVIDSTLNPTYIAKNDTFEWNTNYRITPALTFTSQTGFNNDYLWSSEDYNRFNTAPGQFGTTPDSILAGYITPDPLASTNGIPSDSGVFCDPQLGCSDRVVAEDLSDERAWQLSQEFRLASNFSGPFNFSFGGNYLHYETEENYYVFINTLTIFALQQMDQTAAACIQTPSPATCSSAALAKGGIPYVPGVTNNHQCLPYGFQFQSPTSPNFIDDADGACPYIDPNPITSLNNEGHNYFLSQNPYLLNSYALFGETYYNITPNLKLTTGLRWTDDRKHFIDIPSELLVPGYGYPVTGIVDQQWEQFTGRSTLDWTPSLDFTDQTLIYGSYAHGYKAGGANPPGAVFLSYDPNFEQLDPLHPLTFKPEYIEAFELGTKNTLLNNSLTINGDIFYYNYTGYQISEIVDRTAINNNYNAHVEGAEVEANWEPLPGLKFNFAGGWENTALAGGDEGIDLMDRTAGMPGWIVAKRFPTEASNCVLPAYVIVAMMAYSNNFVDTACNIAYDAGLDPVTGLPYVANPSVPHASLLPGTLPANITPYPGFDPLSVDPNAPANVNNGLGLPPNNGEGFDKNLSGNKLPNAPPFTVSLGAEYSLPVSDDWVATLRGDYSWQDASWARVFNDNPYDKLGAYTNVNVALILNSANGWQVMGYVKNVFNVTAITGDFLNSDDSGLTTNVFLTDPRLFGVRVTKQLDQADGFWGSDYSGYEFFNGLFADSDNGTPPLWIEFGAQTELTNGFIHPLSTPFAATDVGDGFTSPVALQRPLSQSFGEEAAITFQPDSSDWVFTAEIRFGRAQGGSKVHQQTPANPRQLHISTYAIPTPFNPLHARYADTHAANSEKHSIIDFEAGQDVGLGMFGLGGSSVLSGGLRIAQFSSAQNLGIIADPDYTLPSSLLADKSRHIYQAASNIRRSFHGLGPTISWKASEPVEGETQTGALAVDWGANAAILFGRQRTFGHHQLSGSYYKSDAVLKYHFTSHFHQSGSPDRSRTVVVPNVGGSIGLSYKFTNAKISVGYRADEFFGALDGGIDTRKSTNVGYFGPYANISIGLGG